MERLTEAETEVILQTIVIATLTIAAPIALDARLRADDIAAQLSAYMDTAAQEENFNGSVLVAKDGKVLFAKGYGLANAEHEIPNTPETKFRLGSLTKGWQQNNLPIYIYCGTAQ